ncbi:hypothetical protein BGZ82_000641 [Podila clonocystis]|nr:hypothetical protein BGZ82_000641 [Podila clonocystis]
MDPNSAIDPGDTFRRDALETLVPMLEETDSQYKEFIEASQEGPVSTEWILHTFRNVIRTIHGRLSISRQLTHIFDEEIRAMRMDSSLEVSAKFLAQFSAELATRLSPSFDEMAYMYFEEVFCQYELSARQHLLDTKENDPGFEISEKEQQEQQRILGKKRRRLMQDGRAAMDLFVDDMDDEVVEQLFHGNTSSSEAKAMTNQDQIQEYLTLCLQLDELDFASRTTDVIMRMLYRQVEAKILDSFQAKWDVPTLESGKEWMIHVVLPFLRLTLLPKKDHSMRERHEIFDIIVECPKSEPAVKDLKMCIGWTGQREQLQKAILAEMDKRLLHPGAETHDLVEFYICAIKHLRILDPSGVMLDQAARAINQYLRTRDDTMQAIVKSIVDDSNNLLDGSTEGIQGGMDVDEDDTDDETTWVPEPANAGPDLTSARRKMEDIISVLASIYDTNDRFIKEFQNILSERLLQATDFQVDREIRQLELLKIRFGEADLHHCEVMLADIAESKRVSANIQERNPSVVTSTLVASRFYWPAIEEKDSFQLPSKYQELLDAFEVEFELSRPAQKLAIFPSLGMVEIELELEGREPISMRVPPIQAAIIDLFEAQDTWKLAEIASKLQMVESALEPKMQFWIQEGVLREASRNKYQLNEGEHSQSQS